MSRERDIIADLCACAATTIPSGEAVCPHGHVPHRTRWRTLDQRFWGIVRLVALVALPVALLLPQSPVVPRPPAPVEAVIAALDADIGAVVKSQLQATVNHNSLVNRIRATAADPRGKEKRAARAEDTQRAVRAIAAALSECQSSLGEKQRWNIARAIEREARRHGYDPLFVQALVEVESTCKPTARSPRGALGLTQVRPATGRALALEAGMPWRGSHSLLDPGLNLRIGLLYLTQLYDQFGDMNLAMAAYNLGPVRAKSLSRDRARRMNYVRKVLARYEVLRASHATAVS